MKPTKVSVIMRCKNSDWVIASALSALFSQDFQDFELIIVDSGSTDKTLYIVAEYPCHLVKIKAEDYFPGKVLNQAIALAKSEIVILLNSDSVMLSPQSLGNLLLPFEQKSTVAVFGRQVARPDAKSWVKRDYQISFPETKNSPQWMTLSAPLAAIRKSIWKIHPFYSQAWASEDTEWGYWAKSNGYHVEYQPSAITMHSHNYSLAEIYQRRFIEGEADAFIYNTNIGYSHTFILYLKSCISDLKIHYQENDILGFLAIPFIRFIYHWAYKRGNKIGRRRQHDNRALPGLVPS